MPEFKRPEIRMPLNYHLMMENIKQPMTKAQFKRLETILGRLEILENEMADPVIREKLGDGKKYLLEAWKIVERRFAL